MREDPGVDAEKISASLEAHYGLRVASVAFLPIGYDPNAAVYEVASRDGGCYFLKVRFGPVHEPGLLVPRALIDLGIRNVLAPLPTRSSDLWCPLGGYPGYAIILYPFVRGENAVVAGLSDDQWRQFGSTLRAVHASGLGGRLRERLGPSVCAHPAPCRIVVNTELVLLPGGHEERHGEPPPPLCGACPEREERRRPVRWVEVIRDLRNRHGGEEPTSAARTASVAHDGRPEGNGSLKTTDAPTAPIAEAPDDGLSIPPAWRDGHPDAHPDQPRPTPRRREAAGGAVTVDPSDFGL